MRNRGVVSMSILQQLIKGNTYAEYDALFTQADFANEDMNMHITQIIDLTICNTGSIMPDEIKALKEALVELSHSRPNSKYKTLLKELLTEVDSFIPKSLNIEIRHLRNVLK